jgi:hypothetical protein
MFDFIYDETGKAYHLWWDSFPEAALGTLREICIGEWECCPQWQAHFRLGLQYQVIHADSKEDAARVWLTEVNEVDEAG